MNEYRLGEVETRFADIIWQNEPLQTRELIALAKEKLNWSKSTTYTILSRLCDKDFPKSCHRICQALSQNN